MRELLDEAVELTIGVLKPLVGQGECVTVCYNQATVWQSRSLAIDFYHEASVACDGCERERYVNVLMDLIGGKAVCYDGVTKYLTMAAEYR